MIVEKKAPFEVCDDLESWLSEYFNSVFVCDMNCGVEIEGQKGKEGWFEATIMDVDGESTYIIYYGDNLAVKNGKIVRLNIC